MKRIFFSVFVYTCGSLSSFCQHSGAVFSCPDTALQRAFEWAKKMALSYRGKPQDPVGPWYESALPPRSAFCMRDVAHQCIGAEMLGLKRENKNMFHLFTGNISASKDWCSYWEINKYNRPAPEDYRNDHEFWYNLNANFDILNACWRLFLWTGDRSYIMDTVFTNFYDRSVNEYIKTWILDEDSLLSRKLHPNSPTNYNPQDPFHRCRGLASYSEGVADLRMGVDLVAAIYCGLQTYADITETKGNKTEADRFRLKAEKYRKHLETYWWDSNDSLYNTYYNETGKFGKDEGETFLLWFDALKDTARLRKTLKHLIAGKWNVENLSYFPCLMFRYGYWSDAYSYLLLLSDPATKRREYPEVSYGVIQGFITGLMGIEADSRYNRVSTLFRTSGLNSAEIDSLDILETSISVRHKSDRESELVNKGKKPLVWRAKFSGEYFYLYDSVKAVRASREKDQSGKTFSFIDLIVPPGKVKNITAPVRSGG